jgi:4-amino-4-deoxy-L-arabinose transferase-like glycosyltransferase
MLVPNIPEFVVAYYAVLRCGGIAVPINVLYKAEEIAYILQDSEAKAFILGYVDHPPLIVLIAWVTRHTLGTSLPALIFWPAMAGVGRILLVAALARALGARSFGTTFAAFVTSLAPVWVAIDHQFAMNALEPLFWIGRALVVVRIVQTENPKLWMAFGMLAGLGLENKYSMAAFAFALLAGILLTRERKILFTPWLFAGGVIALLIFLPNLWWNINHHWPFFELMHNIRVTGKDVVLSPSEFLAQQVQIIGPTALPVWFAGLLMYLFSREQHPYRALGYAFVITIAFFILAHGKNYYSAPAYGVVFAGGALAIERLFSSDWMRHGNLVKDWPWLKRWR